MLGPDAQRSKFRHGNVDVGIHVLSGLLGRAFSAAATVMSPATLEHENFRSAGGEFHRGQEI